MHGYPGIFAIAGFFRTSALLIGMLTSWSQSVRDKEFLLEMRLRNHEPEQMKMNAEAVELLEDEIEDDSG